MSESPEPLVLLPFPAERLGELGVWAQALRFAHLPPGAQPSENQLAETRFLVPPYLFREVDRTIFARLPKLEVVQSLTAGVEHLAPLVPAGVTLCSGRGIHDTSTAELAVALILASLRGLPDSIRAQDEGRWAWRWVDSLADRRVLIIGAGAIGRALQARLAPFECDVQLVGRSARDDAHAVTELPDLLPSADVVVVVVPLTESTRGLVDESFLATMKPGALLVNVGRGAVVDTGALISTLHGGELRAALDVTDPEPLPHDHPLWGAPNLLISHHTGGSSSAMWPRAYRIVREQLQRYAAGQPLANVMTSD